MKELSIIVVSWNTKDILRDCLLSVYKYLRNISYEVFVVDNGSTDGSQEMIKSEFPKVILIENRTNLGFAMANNIAMRQARGDFFLLLNSDTILKEGAIQGVLNTMKEDESIGIGGLQLLNSDGSLQNSVSPFPSLLTELTNKSFLKLILPRKFYRKSVKEGKPIEVDTLIGAFMMVRRKAVEDVGFLDEDYFFFFEETDWCLRMKRAGWKVVFDPRYSIYHLQGQSVEQVNVRARIEYWKSRYTYFRKHYGKRTQQFLKYCLVLRLLINISMTLIVNVVPNCKKTKKYSDRLKMYLAILKWHLKKCQQEWGLNPKLNENT